MIAANYFKFEDNEDPGEEEENKRPVERWGFWKNDDTVVINSTIFERIMKQGGFQGKSFLSWAKKHDLLELGEGGRTKKKIKNKVFSGRGVVIKTTYGEPEETAVLGALADEMYEDLPFK